MTRFSSFLLFLFGFLSVNSVTFASSDVRTGYFLTITPRFYTLLRKDGLLGYVQLHPISHDQLVQRLFLSPDDKYFYTASADEARRVMDENDFHEFYGDYSVRILTAFQGIFLQPEHARAFVYDELYRSGPVEDAGIYLGV